MSALVRCLLVCLMYRMLEVHRWRADMGFSCLQASCAPSMVVTRTLPAQLRLPQGCASPAAALLLRALCLGTCGMGRRHC